MTWNFVFSGVYEPHTGMFYIIPVLYIRIVSVPQLLHRLVLPASHPGCVGRPPHIPYLLSTLYHRRIYVRAPGLLDAHCGGKYKNMDTK